MISYQNQIQFLSKAIKLLITICSDIKYIYNKFIHFIIILIILSQYLLASVVNEHNNLIKLL